MTLAELTRAIESKKRIEKLKAQERASYDYILADLVGRSMGRFYSSANQYPEISVAYPTLFDSKEAEERKAEAKTQLSALRFKMFADSHNKKFKEASKNE